MLKDKIISQADYDTAVAGHRQAMAQVDDLRATIAKKTIRAPFGGRLGIRQVNLGQILREGDPIVTLQSLDPIFVDFTLPQQELCPAAHRPAGAGDQRCPARPDDRRAHHDHEPAGGRRNPQRPAAGDGGEPGGKAPARDVRQRGGRPPGPAEGAGHSGHGRPLRPLRRLGLRRRGRQGGEGGQGAAPAVRAARREARRLRRRHQRAEGGGDRSSAPASSSCATARRWWSTTSSPRRSGKRPARRTTDR